MGVGTVASILSNHGIYIHAPISISPALLRVRTDAAGSNKFRHPVNRVPFTLNHLHVLI
jgi:hypothetical protein